MSSSRSTEERMSQSSLKRSSGDAKLELLQCTSKKLFGAPILKQRKKPLQRRGQAKPEFADYIPLSKEFTTETDHKPLMPSLDQNVFTSCLPASTISHETDAILEIDSLRSWKRPLQSTNEEKQLNDELNLYVSHVTDYLWIRLYRDENEICSNLKEFCREGWSNKHSLKFGLPSYWQYRGEITVQQDILIKGDRVIISSTLRLDVLDKIHIHTGHQGIQKCRERAKSGVW